MKKLTGTAAAALLVITLLSINYNDSDDKGIQTAGTVTDPLPAVSLDQQSEDTYLVTRVVDGDTIIVNMYGVEERVRLIGVDN
jgi:endonuclease YncB( thermonuclease family)